MLVVRGHGVPRRPWSPGLPKAFLVGGDVVVPAVALVEIARIELPVLLGLVDTLEEAFTLLGLRYVEPELQDDRTLLGEITLVVCDRSQPIRPELGRRLGGQALRRQEFRMHAND